MFKVLTRRATIPLVAVRLLLSPPACVTVEGLTDQHHVQAAASSLSSLKRQLYNDRALCEKLRRHLTTSVCYFRAAIQSFQLYFCATVLT